MGGLEGFRARVNSAPAIGLPGKGKTRVEGWLHSSSINSEQRPRQMTGSAAYHSTFQQISTNTHLCKLHRHLVVDRQQLPLTRLDGRLAAGAALSLRWAGSGVGQLDLVYGNRRACVWLVDGMGLWWGARKGGGRMAQPPECAPAATRMQCLLHVGSRDQFGVWHSPPRAPATCFPRFICTTPTLSLRITGSMRCMVATSSGVRYLISTTPWGSSTPPCKRGVGVGGLIARMGVWWWWWGSALDLYHALGLQHAALHE